MDLFTFLEKTSYCVSQNPLYTFLPSVYEEGSCPSTWSRLISVVLDIVVLLCPFSFKSCPFCVHVCACMRAHTHMHSCHITCVPWHVCRGQKTVCKGHLSPSTMWALGMTLGPLGLAANMPYPLNQAISLLLAFSMSVNYLHGFDLQFPLEMWSGFYVPIGHCISSSLGNASSRSFPVLDRVILWLCIVFVYFVFFYQLFVSIPLELV